MRHQLNHASFQRNKQTSRLLRLPAELRNRVFGYVFGGKSIALYIKNNVGSYGGEIRPYSTPPDERFYSTIHSQNDILKALTVCRQIYSECRDLPFSLSLFRYHDPLQQILALWSSKRFYHLSLIRAVRLYSSGDSCEIAQWLDGLQYFSGLRIVEVKAYNFYNDTTSMDAVLDKVKKWEVSFKQKVRAKANERVEVVFYPVLGEELFEMWTKMKQDESYQKKNFSLYV